MKNRRTKLNTKEKAKILAMRYEEITEDKNILLSRKEMNIFMIGKKDSLLTLMI